MSAVVVALVVIACGEEPNIEEIACDEAAAKLEECCDDFAASAVDCRVDRTGCRGSTTSTGVQITLRDADTCILHATCAEIVGGGICEAAKDATRSYSHYDDGQGMETSDRLSACPALRGP